MFFAVLVPLQSPAPSQPGNRAGPGHQGPSRCTDRSHQHQHSTDTVLMHVRLQVRLLARPILCSYTLVSSLKDPTGILCNAVPHPNACQVPIRPCQPPNSLLPGSATQGEVHLHDPVAKAMPRRTPTSSDQTQQAGSIHAALCYAAGQPNTNQRVPACSSPPASPAAYRTVRTTDKPQPCAFVRHLVYRQAVASDQARPFFLHPGRPSSSVIG